MGLSLAFFATAPCPPFHVADNRLPSSMDMDMFNNDLLLSIATMTMQGFQQSCE